MLDAWLLENPQQPAIVNGSQTTSRAQLRAASIQAAQQLASLGVRRGDVIALWLPDGLAWLQILFAAARMGVLVIPVSTRYREREVRHLLEVSGAKLVMVTETFLSIPYAAIARQIKAELNSLEQVVLVTDAAHEWQLNVSMPERSEPPPDVDGLHPGAQSTDLCCAFSTSGTTGFPKLAVHDQDSIVRHAQAAVKAFDIRPGDALLCALPFYGVYGFMSTLAALAGGARCVLLPVFDAKAAADTIAAHQITHVFGSDTAFAAILGVADANLSSWRVGGMADFAGLSARVAQDVEQRFGTKLIGLYGSSECFALTAARSIDEPLQRRVVSGGVPISPDIEYRIVDPADNRILPDGEQGELQMRGYCVLAGYLNNETATTKAFTSDGWFRTGDLCYRQPPTEGGGFVYRSRMNDSLRLRGYLVDPSEIEACLMTHPAVQGAQVVGVNRTGEGDIAVAFIVQNPDLAATADNAQAEIIEHCRAQIAAYKAPRHIVFVNEFPSVNGPNGVKIQKTKLREMAAAQFAQ